ncbi:MAG: hypothetical protein WCO68_04025 [Verrucomicrobiota bacterium]
MRAWLAVCFVANFVVGAALAQTPAPTRAPLETPDTLATVPFERLTDKALTVDGRRALAIRPGEWKHAETEHFVLHFFRTFIAAPVSVEAEFYYRYILADLGASQQTRTYAGGGGKTHIYLFESREDWVEFRKAAFLESWTGAVHIDGALFVPRYPEFKWKGNALGHEISHLMVKLFVGTRLPLWLSEGYAEDVSSRGNSAFYRARGYLARPMELMAPGYMPLARLTSLTAYPPEAEIKTFYRESRSLAAFMSSEGNKARFLKMFTAMAQGAPFSLAWKEVYGSRWLSLDAMELEFKKYLEQNENGS